MVNSMIRQTCFLHEIIHHHRSAHHSETKEVCTAASSFLGLLNSAYPSINTPSFSQLFVFRLVWHCIWLGTDNLDIIRSTSDLYPRSVRHICLRRFAPPHACTWRPTHTIVNWGLFTRFFSTIIHVHEFTWQNGVFHDNLNRLTSLLCLT